MKKPEEKKVISLSLSKSKNRELIRLEEAPETPDDI